MDSINSVNVVSIDEERLKFRVLVGIIAGGAAIPQSAGQFLFDLPPLTSFGNSNNYNQCVITCDGLSCHALPGQGDFPIWTDGNAATRTGCLDLHLDLPSSQAASNQQATALQAGTGQLQIGGYRQLVPIVANLMGNSDGLNAAGAAAAPATIGQGMGCYSWQGVGLGEPILSANPFGNKVRITMEHSSLPRPMFLANVGALPVDIGSYSFQFTITMVHNK
tara:strand:+ start:333 stop:995 length:663 start_codon:yes stop_codon:yes gene_type:complete